MTLTFDLLPQAHHAIAVHCMSTMFVLIAEAFKFQTHRQSHRHTDTPSHIDYGSPYPSIDYCWHEYRNQYSERLTKNVTYIKLYCFAAKKLLFVDVKTLILLILTLILLQFKSSVYISRLCTLFEAGRTLSSQQFCI